jgi:hypothetical protein
MAESSGQTAVATTAVLIGTTGNGADIVLDLTNGSAVIAVGGPSVTMLTGELIPANAERQFHLSGDDALYAICATSSTVSWLISGETLDS